jgi:transcriptional regulatory protein LEU3
MLMAILLMSAFVCEYIFKVLTHYPSTNYNLIRFFSNYSSYLPIFTSRLAPDECYKSSLTLFWAIIVVGSRRLKLDPTLLGTLAPEVLNLALTSFQSRRNRTDDIRGLLILCTWPCPSTSLLRDNTVALSSLLFSLSMQAGLHVPPASSRFALLKGPETENLSRQVELASLWVHVVIACQR